MRCGRVWVCPVCAAKISETRRTELNELLLAAREVALGYNSGEPEYYPRWHLTMLTYTIQHGANESAADVLARLDRTWKRYSAGRWIQRFRERFYIVGTLRALELTHGSAGWHPHFHVLQFHDSVLREQIATGTQSHPSQPEMIALARLRWSECALKTGGYADPTIGVDLTVGKVQDYPLKSDGEKELQRWGMTSEVTKQPAKRGRDGNRSMIDLLIDASNGDELAGQFWLEAVAALEGHKQLEPSKGLWVMLGRKLKTEEEAAEDEADPSDEVLAALSWEQWKIVLNADARGALLDIASTGDSKALLAFLAELGVYRAEIP